jgi:hypothetical protein
VNGWNGEEDTLFSANYLWFGGNTQKAHDPWNRERVFEPGFSRCGGLEIYIYKMHGEGALPTSTTYGVGVRAIDLPYDTPFSVDGYKLWGSEKTGLQDLLDPTFDRLVKQV